jgi:hypothetical protein
MEFHENLSRESGFVPWGRTDGLAETDMTKLIVAFRNFANAPKHCAWSGAFCHTGHPVINT